MAKSSAAGWDCHVHVFDGRAPAAAGAHYRPVHRPLAEVEALAQAHGCGHVVLVQPSVHGSDNGLLLQALRGSGDRHRGVVVLDGGEDAGRLRDMHEAGVRGVRFNLVSPVGSGVEAAQALLAALAPMLDALGWHVQWYARPAMLPALARLQRALRLPFVLDHLAGLTPAHLADDAAWTALAQLAAAGGWVKLSGWYRLAAPPPYGALQPVVRRLAELFGERMVWGSDWPHTSFPPGELPPYESLWAPVLRALGDAGAQRVRLAGALLYA